MLPHWARGQLSPRAGLSSIPFHVHSFWDLSVPFRDSVIYFLVHWSLTSLFLVYVLPKQAHVPLPKLLPMIIVFFFFSLRPSSLCSPEFHACVEAQRLEFLGEGMPRPGPWTATCHLADEPSWQWGWESWKCEVVMGEGFPGGSVEKDVNLQYLVLLELLVKQLPPLPQEGLVLWCSCFTCLAFSTGLISLATPTCAVSICPPAGRHGLL